MSFTNNLMSYIGFKKNDDCGCAEGCDVEIKDGKIIGNPYAQFSTIKSVLSAAELDEAYKKISCIGSSVDLISENMQMIEPVFYNDDTREFVEYPKDKRLKRFKRVFYKPNSIDNRKSFIDKAVKSFEVHGVIYFAFILDSDNQPISIKVIDNNLVSAFVDKANSRIDNYMVVSAGAYNGRYIFDGSYYTNEDNNKMILAPFINAASDFQYLPASPLLGTGLETLMYWYGCFHNKSLLENGARPSMILMIKSLLNPKHKEQLKQEIRIKHSGVGNAGSAIIIDGAADKELKQLSQNNKDMEFAEILKAAEGAVYKRLGTTWLLGEKVQSKDYQKCLEMFYDMKICPLFQAIYNHLFEVYKKYNQSYNNYSIYYLEQDIPALRPRFLEMMKNMPNLGIFTLNERRRMMNYPPLDDERGEQLVTQTVSVYQQGMNPEKQNTTEFSGDN